MTKSKQMSWRSGAVAALMILGSAGAAKASSHREAPAITQDPAADNTDLWAWMSGDNHTLYVVASYNPLEEPSGGPNFHKFSDDVLYQIHITDPGTPVSDGGAAYDLNDKVTYQLRFTTAAAPYVDPANLDAGPRTTPDYVGGGKEFFSQIALQPQSYTLTKVDSAGNATDLIGGNSGVAAGSVAPPNIGPSTQATCTALGLPLYTSANYDQAYETSFIVTSSGYQAFAGPTDDGFYVDLGGVFDLANLRGPVTFADAGTNANPAQDGCSGFNVHTIALAIPTTEIFGTNGTPHIGTAGDDSTIGVWASASRKKVKILRNDGTTSWYGPWVQVSRLGLPLINEAVIGVQDKDKYNRTTPATDVANFAGYFLNPVIVRDADAVGIYQALGAEGDVGTLEAGRVDVLNTINLSTNHHIAIAPGVTGDVLRVDTALASGFPNGRSLPMVAGSNTEGNDVTDTLLTVLLSEGLIGIHDNVDHNDVNYPGVFPFLALPHQGYAGGHGKPASP